ncbi:MAG: BTAD domain-containing putative transcriptional regulator, partial [Anaerolineae bacterium]
MEKNNEFRINLLGPWQVTKNGEPLTDFRGDSVRALLTYLIIENSSPQSRRFLASFLWEDLDEEAAMRNVRVSLTRLRKGLGDDTADVPLLYVDRQSVGLDPRANYTLDTDQFEQTIAHSRRSIEPGRSPDRRVLARLKRAVELYRADFLQGFTHPSAPFEEWMLVRRERFHGDALWALHVLADHALRIQDWHTAVDYAQRQINLEAWSEEGFQQLIQAQIELGQRSAAIASYERCKQVLWDELGVEPDEQIQKLFEQAHDGETSLAEEKPTPHNLPTAGSNFFSREAEIDFLLNRMADPDGRLTTILGEGGVGKSRLSQYVGRRVLRDFKDGVWFVPLDHIEPERPEAIAVSAGVNPTSEESEIIRLMIDTLGVPLAGNRPDREQLLGWLARKELLLILDNFEHLIDAAEFVNDILETAAQAAVIVTSRIPLNLRQETLLPLSGLSIDGAELAQAPAIRLFFDRADRAGAAYEMDEVTLEAVADTCEQMGGNALAIELAAVWMRQMTAVEIAAEVRQSIDFLGTTHRDMPERHRSMRAVFDQT